MDLLDYSFFKCGILNRCVFYGVSCVKSLYCLYIKNVKFGLHVVTYFIYFVIKKRYVTNPSRISSRTLVLKPVSRFESKVKFSKVQKAKILLALNRWKMEYTTRVALLSTGDTVFGFKMVQLQMSNFRHFLTEDPNFQVHLTLFLEEIRSSSDPLNLGQKCPL